MNLTDIKYDIVRDWISSKRNNTNKKTGNQNTWDEIFLACKRDEDALINFLDDKVIDDDWPELTVDEWKLLVQSQKEAEEDTIKIARENGAAVICQDGQDNGLFVPQNRASAWQCYKRGLLEGGKFTKVAIETMECATLRVLKRLNEDTRTTGPVKGMVVGNVQSGKTANMAALMAMAADYGWNMFIVLSGTIENLRIQTLNRLQYDLRRRNCNLQWCPINRLSLKKGEITLAPQDLWLNDNDTTRYFTVCLKNSARLRSMLQYLQYDVNVQRKLKILVIEDEADQASINTADVNKEERTQINRLLCNLVNGKTHEGNDCAAQYKSLNYVGFTATPYANFLNENERESLYPKDFISTLSVSKEYFGPQQIFGIEGGVYDGLDIVRNVSQSDLDRIQDIHDGALELPVSLRNAICWFICGAATMRKWGYKKPISMLVHTSQRTSCHTHVANAIDSWIMNTSDDDILNACHDVWNKETKQFSLDKFKEQYPDYGRDFADINEYPEFEDIVEFIKGLLNDQRIEPISIDDSNETPKFHKNIHLCIDNSAQNNNTKNEHIRLVYPNKQQLQKLGIAPAFIIVGGATLSRGLTIEGLISTFFLRSVKQSDTLMQMGRWFGYRNDYELIPRLWLTSNTVKQFEFLSSLDQELRDEIHQMSALGLSPAHYGPKVKNSPKLSFISIVAKNKMQAAEPADRDYSGSFKQTQLFDKDADILQSNLDCTRTFLQGLGQPEVHKPINVHAANSHVWRGVDFSFVKEFLEHYHFHTRQGVFNDIKTMIDWIGEITKKGVLRSWNVVLVGAAQNDSHQSDWKVYDDGRTDDVRIFKVHRSQLKDEKKNNHFQMINIGALRAPKDIIADIDLERASTAVRAKASKFESRYAMELRDEAGLQGVPQVLVYIVDKDSPANSDSEVRMDLNSPVDLAGICINIPGDSVGRDNVARVAMKMPPATIDVYDDKGDLNGTAED